MAGKARKKGRRKPIRMEIHGIIGFDNTADQVRSILSENQDRAVVLSLDSPGGDSREGVAIFNALKRHPRHVRVEMLSRAYSAGSYIALAGDERLIARNGVYMIHRAWSIASGTAREMESAVNMLKADDAAYRDTYAEVAGLTADEAFALMDAETFLTAEQAIEQGFATGYLDLEDGVETEEPSIDQNLAQTIEMFPFACSWIKRAAAFKRDGQEAIGLHSVVSGGLRPQTGGSAAYHGEDEPGDGAKAQEQDMPIKQKLAEILDMPEDTADEDLYAEVERLKALDTNDESDADDGDETPEGEMGQDGEKAGDAGESHSEADTTVEQPSEVMALRKSLALSEVERAKGALATAGMAFEKDAQDKVTALIEAGQTDAAKLVIDAHVSAAQAYAKAGQSRPAAPVKEQLDAERQKEEDNAISRMLKRAGAKKPKK